MLKLSFDGASHGAGYSAALVGLPRGCEISVAEIKKELARRRAGAGRSQRQLAEKDEVVFLSGLDNGVTDGGVLRFFVPNSASAGADVELPAITALRSGHADLVGCTKLGLENARFVCEEASARNTVVYTVAGAVCRQILQKQGISFFSYAEKIGGTAAEVGELDEDALKEMYSLSVRCPDSSAALRMEEEILSARAKGETLGGSVRVICRGLPAGLGDFKSLESRLSGKIAARLASIPSVKGVCFGDGEHFEPDELALDGDKVVYATNRCGGIVGGVTNGKDLSVALTVKPVPTRRKPIETIDIVTRKTVGAHFERADVCVVESIGIIAENLLALEMLDCILEENRLSFGSFDRSFFDGENTVFATDAAVAALLGLDGENVFCFADGEKAKSFEEIMRFLNFLSARGCGKDTLVVAVGGGAVGDAAGFAASVFCRGVRLAHVPTTLLAMLDSSVGGKTAVNFSGVKNVVGTIYPAELTLVDLSLLDTMPENLIDEGKGELFKYACLDEKISRLIDENADLKTLVRQCARFKQRTASIDPNDLLLRRKLNLGHTLGHAFEAIYGLSHGAAVANGLFYETALAFRLGICARKFWQKQSDLLKKNFQIVRDIDVIRTVELCLSDKKNISRKISLVLPDGRFGVREIFLTEVELTELLKDVV